MCRIREGGWRDLLEEGFGERNVLIGCAWGSVDEEVVEWRPEDGGEELADHGCFFGAAPYYGGGFGRKQVGERNGVDGADRLLIAIYGR